MENKKLQKRIADAAGAINMILYTSASVDLSKKKALFKRILKICEAQIKNIDTFEASSKNYN